MVIFSRLGGTRAATFCLLSTLQDQLQQDGFVDVYMNAKVFHLKRPGVFPTEVRNTPPVPPCFIHPHPAFMSPVFSGPSICSYSANNTVDLLNLSCKSAF